MAKRVPTRILPNWLVRLVSLFEPALRSVVPDLGKIKVVTNEKARTVLGWTPRSLRESVLDTAESLISAGIIRPRKPPK